MTEKVFGVMKDLKVGKYVLIDDVPCRIVGIESSAPGKHGAAKMRVTAMGIFDSQKRTLLKPADADAEIPIIERKTGQVVSISGDNAQIMDLADYSTFEITIPQDMKNEVAAGKEVEYMESMGKKIIMRVRG
ncbi:MAG: translation initiation factor 5A [Candidatus Fermentimicrarchaeum limneticum]|uniref:Translation initiation factor 5A n=1 Tax=Fermentimicrarchaeum limneticum TaxID=2795018 RepID=A0A7D6BN11_FERL1|nr:MAG: translation initiation factor 5A [Candidatus Fermentimicrarchaeum limneticum]